MSRRKDYYRDLKKNKNYLASRQGQGNGHGGDRSLGGTNGRSMSQFQGNKTTMATGMSNRREYDQLKDKMKAFQRKNTGLGSTTGGGKKTKIKVKFHQGGS